MDEGYEVDVGLTGHVPRKALRELLDLYSQHRLFLDTECIVAMDLIIECFRDSQPFDDGANPPEPKNVSVPYQRVQFLQRLLSDGFREKIGVGARANAMRDITLFAALKILNRMHFPDIGLPPKSALKLEEDAYVMDGILRCKKNERELIEKLRSLVSYLKTLDGFGESSILKAESYLEILDSPT